VVIDALPAAGPLPHPSRFADVVMADLAAPGCPAQAELERIANVGATLHLRVSGTWQAKPRPPEAGIAGWTHKWYDATGNMVSADAKVGPPETVQWQAGPAFMSSDKTGLHVAVDSGAFVATDDGTLMVRSSGSGLPRWRSQAALHGSDEFLIDGDRILARGDSTAGHGGKPLGRSECGALIAYNLADGATSVLTEAPVLLPTQFFKKTHGFPSTVVTGNAIVAAAGADLAVLDRASGKRKWSITLPDGIWFSPRVLDDAVIAVECPVGAKVERGRVDSAYQVRAIHAYGLADGKLRWKTACVLPDPTQPDRIDPKTGKPSPDRASLKPLTCAAGTVFLITSSYQCRANDAFIAAIDAKDGKLRWKTYSPEGNREKIYWSRTDSSGNIVYRDDFLYFVAGFGNVGAYGSGPVAKFDPATGNRLSITSAPGKGFGACGMSRATVNWFIKSAQTWNDKEFKQVERLAARGPCGSGGFPAQGMFYVQPSVCDCQDQSRGFLGMASEAPLPI
ncbi:MAG: PQQ-binding-like beta-propeller repeat protein, partial [Phycisphaerae bacterium]